MLAKLIIRTNKQTINVEKNGCVIFFGKNLIIHSAHIALRINTQFGYERTMNNAHDQSRVRYSK